MMKKILTLSGVWISLAVLFLSCSKDSDPKKITASDGEMVATIDSESWKSTEVYASIKDGNVFIQGSSTDGGYIILSVAGTETGTFNVGGPSAFAKAFVSLSTKGNTYASTYYSVSMIAGEVVITEIDETNKTISGTFFSKVKRTTPDEEVMISDGVYTKIPYEED